MSTSIYRIGDVRERPLPDQRPDDPPIVTALRYGVTAPSAHNTQPWRIELISDTQARVFVDPGRRLPHVDPPGRQLLIGHGTLIEMTSIAATGLGFRAEIDMLPDVEIAPTDIGTMPTATIRLAAAPDITVDPLFSRILHRRSSRLAHLGPPLTPEQRADIEQHARIPGVDVGWIPRGILPEVLRIAADAMAVEAEDRDLYDETRLWFRFSDREIAESGDGLHMDTAGLSGPALLLARMFTKDGNWHKAYNRNPYLSGFRRAVGTTTDLLTVSTASNTMSDWIIAGRAYVRADLAADAFGLHVHPVSQALQEFPQMDKLRTELEQLTGTAAPAKMQMLVRVGRTAPPGLSPRRDLREIIDRGW